MRSDVIGEYITVWDKSDAKSNDILRSLMRQAKYKWVYRKLDSARWHIISTRAHRVPESDVVERHAVPTNGEVYP